MTDMMSDSLENKGIIVYISVLLPLPIQIRTDNRTCTKQPNAAVKVI